MLRFSTLTICCALVGLLALPVSAQPTENEGKPLESGENAADAEKPTESSKPKGDPRVKTVLEELGLKHRVDEDGDFVVGFLFDDKRSHQVFIDSAVTEYRHIEIREVWAVAHVSETPLDAKTANALLAENADFKLGGWKITRFRENHVVIFGVKTEAETDAKTLEAILRIVSQAADNREKTLSGNDQF